MISKELTTVAPKSVPPGSIPRRIGPHLWIIVFVAFIVIYIGAGCAVSERAPISKHLARSSATTPGSITAENNIAPDSNSSAGASGDEDFELLEEELAEQMIKVADPLEPVNRITYFVNDTLHFWVLKPVSQFYTDVTPEPVRTGIRNFFRNLTTPIRFSNCLLQGKGDSAGTELNRFFINTTIGILGFGDPARQKYGLEPVKEDLGQTLAVYGLGDGLYLVLPLLGPSTLRDTAGRVGDSFLNPVRYVEPTETAIGISAVKATNESSFHIGEYEDLKAGAVDPYVAMRNFYLQHRKKQIQK